MAFTTDLKRARGLGSANQGTSHFWRVTVSSVALLILVPLFVFTVAPMLGEPYTEVTTYLARPFPAIVTALTLLVGFLHFKDGVQVAIEDYVHGLAGKIAIIVMICISYAAAATGLFALGKLAL